MNIVPSHKQDFQSCENLQLASDREVLEKIEELLSWLKDFNWPVAKEVLKRISKLKSLPRKPINSILEGDDDVWKYWVISKLISKMPNESRSNYLAQLGRIINEPTKGKIEEEVHLVAQEAIRKNV